MKTGRNPRSSIDFLSNYRKSEISDLAEEVANYYSSEDIVDPEIIASSNDITYCYGNYKNAFDGLLEFSNDSFHIYINLDRLNEKDSPRARFTFAHELGHYYLDSHRNALSSGKSPSHSSFTGFRSTSYVEREADYFATCLLIPKDKLIKEVYRKKFEFKTIHRISNKFQTSFTASALRFTDIGNHPILVVLSKAGKIKWFWHSHDFPFHSLLHGKEKVPEDTVAGEYFDNGAAPPDRQEVFAIDWFKNVWDSDVDRRFYEQCLFFKDNVISIIWED